MGCHANCLVRSLASAQMDLERKQEAWATVNRQARSLALVGKLASLATWGKVAQELEQTRNELMALSQNLLKALQGMLQAAPNLQGSVQYLQQYQQELQQWQPSQSPVRTWGQEQAPGEGQWGPGEQTKHFMQYYAPGAPSQQSSRLLEIAEGALKVVQAAKLDMKPIQRIASLVEKVAQPQGDLTQRLEQVEQQRQQQVQQAGPTSEQLKDLRRVVNQGSEQFRTLQTNFRQDAKAQEIARNYISLLRHLDNELQLRNASVQDLVKIAAKAQKLLRQAATYIYRRKTASINKNEAISKIAQVDRGLEAWNATRLSSSICEAQNDLFLAVRKLEASKGLFGHSPLLREAWNELESVDSDLTKVALEDMSDDSEEEEADDLVKEIEDTDPEELAEALSETMTSSRVAKGKKKVLKKKPAKRKVKKTKKKRKKKIPAIGDDPWCGKKQTFDSAFKKVDKARSQLTKLMAKLAETSLVRGDVRYALSMLEKVLGAMQRC